MVRARVGVNAEVNGKIQRGRRGDVGGYARSEVQNKYVHTGRYRHMHRQIYMYIYIYMYVYAFIRRTRAVYYLVCTLTDIRIYT